MPPTKGKRAVAEAAPLPALDSIDSIDAASVPVASKLALTEADITFAKAIIAAAGEGRLARGPKVATKDEARNSGSRVKRLVARYYRSQGIAKGDAPAVSTRIVSRDGGFAFAVAIAPKVAATPATDAANGTNTEAAAVAATA